MHIGRPRFKPGSPKAFAIAAALTVAAAVLWLVFRPQSLPFVTFYPTVIAVTFLCGTLAGLFAMGLAVTMAHFVILTPSLPDIAVGRTALFLVGAATVVFVIAAMRDSAEKLGGWSESVRLSEEKFRGLLESAPDALVIVDESWHIAIITTAAETLFGYPRTELLGQPVEMLLSEAGRQIYLDHVKKFAASDGAAAHSRVIDLYGLTKDGRCFPAAIRLGLLKTGSDRLVLSAIRDITPRREIEARLEEASKAKSEFLARMSHELRTPLNAIIGFSELIRNEAIAPLDVRYKEYGADINSAGRHLLNIVNDILDISKIEDGRLQLREEVLSVSEAVEACRRLISVMAVSAGVSLDISMPNALPSLRADGIRLRQILINVMSNAVKFTPSGGQVRVIVSVSADGIVFAVQDTGIGMSPQDIKTALEPFGQVEGALSRRFAGTGLGLPLTKALVELHGGVLEIESTPGVGTVVEIRLPGERIIQAAA